MIDVVGYIGNGSESDPMAYVIVNATYVWGRHKTLFMLRSVKLIALNTYVVVLKVLISRNIIIGSAPFSLDLIRAWVWKG